MDSVTHLFSDALLFDFFFVLLISFSFSNLVDAKYNYVCLFVCFNSSPSLSWKQCQEEGGLQYSGTTFITVPDLPMNCNKGSQKTP